MALERSRKAKCAALAASLGFAKLTLLAVLVDARCSGATIAVDALVSRNGRGEPITSAALWVRSPKSLPMLGGPPSSLLVYICDVIVYHSLRTTP
jgi:hypothetical protein